MLAALVVLVAVAGVYIQALGGPFLWDDRALVLDAPLVEKSVGLGEYLTHPFWMGAGAQPESTSYYRPLVTLSFALDHRLHGTNTGGYHLTNVVLHLACAWLLLALLRRGGVRQAAAGLLATAWALLPRLAEAAAWISGRTDLLATAFALGALLAWGPSPWRRSVAALLCGMGLLAKESALAVLPALMVAEWVSAAAVATRERARLVLWRVAPLSLVVALYGASRLALIGYHDEMLTLGAGPRALAVLQSVGTYALMLLDAWRPRAIIGRLGALSPLVIVLGALLLALAAFGTLRFRGRIGPGAALGLSLALFSLIPVLHLVPIPLRTLCADRFLYLPTAGLVLALGRPLDRWLGVERLRWGAAGVVALSLAVTTWRRVAVWSDETEFWITTYLETPRTNNAAATELFGVYYRAGLYEDALTLTERALRYDDPSKKNPRYNSALCLSRLGRRKEAEERFRASRVKHGSNAGIDLSLAILALQTGADDAARAELTRLAAAGDRHARGLLVRFPELVAARSELERLGPSGEPERRARLATLLGEVPESTSAWLDVVKGGRASRETLRDALLYLVQTGRGDGIAAAARAYLARYGALDAALAGVVEVRLGELDRLAAARGRLGLGSGSVRDAVRD